MIVVTETKVWKLGAPPEFLIRIRLEVKKGDYNSLGKEPTTSSKGRE
jgi:hypothetical protein